MFRRTFLSTIIASVAALFGVRKSQAIYGPSPLRGAYRPWKAIQDARLRSLEQLWLAVPDSEGHWWHRKNKNDFALIVTVFKKDDKLYFRYWERQEFRYVEKLASEMGGEWKFYSK